MEPSSPIKQVNVRGASQRAPLPPCCADITNVVQMWTRHDLRLTICKVCGHKYYRLFADPGSLGDMFRGRR